MSRRENVSTNVGEQKIEKKINFIIGITFAILLVICIIGYNYSVKNYGKIISESSNETQQENYNNVEVATQLFEVKEYPNVTCTTSTMQMAKKFMSNFTQQDESQVEIDVLKKNTAYEKLIKGETDLILVMEPSKEEMQKAKELGVELASYKVANEGLVFITNTQNKVSNVTLKQIQKIYTGEENNWSSIDGSDEEIIVCQRQKDSESQLGMLSLVMDGLEMTEKSEKNSIADVSTLVNVISNNEDNPGAIGYLYYNSWIYGNNSIKSLSVNGVPPTYETIKNETYPIKTGYYAVIREKDEDNDKIKQLVDAMLSKRGKKLVEDAGYIAPK